MSSEQMCFQGSLRMFIINSWITLIIQQWMPDHARLLVSRQKKHILFF